LETSDAAVRSGRRSPPATATRLQEELLGTNAGDKKVTERGQSLVLAVSKLEKIQIGSIIRNERHHGTGRTFARTTTRRSMPTRITSTSPWRSGAA
jgi:hypothetical protein